MTDAYLNSIPVVFGVDCGYVVTLILFCLSYFRMALMVLIAE